jgi:hypothetical protein
MRFFAAMKWLFALISAKLAQTKRISVAMYAALDFISLP